MYFILDISTRGTATQLSVTTTRIDMTEDAEVFQPTDRKCWLKKEIELEHFPYNEDYR